MIEGNELSIYGDRAVSELTTLRPCAERGGRMGRENAVGENVRERGRPEHSEAPLPPTPTVQR